MKRRVLVVEDDNDVRSGLVEVLESENYFVEAAENGQKALDFLRTNNDLPELILLDLMMPVMDGLTFLKIIKDEQSEKFGHIPVVVTTALRNDGIRKTPGVSGFVGKPIDIEELFSTVSSCLT